MVRRFQKTCLAMPNAPLLSAMQQLEHKNCSITTQVHYAYDGLRDRAHALVVQKHEH